MTQFGVPQGGELLDGDRYATWDAAYVLGSLSSAERREYEAHLEGCARCRAAVAELSGIPSLLSMLSLDDVLALDDEPTAAPPPDEMLDSVVAKVNWRRRRSRWVTSVAVGVAAALLAIGAVVAIRPETVGLQSQTTQAAAPVLEMQKLAPTPFSATVSLNSFAWGTRIDMACTYGDWSSGGGASPSNLGMVVVGRDGSHTEVATWKGLSGATALPSGNTPMQVSEIAAVQLVSTDDGKVLLEKQL
jgi:putative zinc finger protein